MPEAATVELVTRAPNGRDDELACYALSPRTAP